MVYVRQGWTNSGRQIAWAAQFWTVAPNFVGSSWNVLYVTPLAPRILRWLLEFWKLCAPVLLGKEHTFWRLSIYQFLHHPPVSSLLGPVFLQVICSNPAAGRTNQHQTQHTTAHSDCVCVVNEANDTANGTVTLYISQYFVKHLKH